MGQNYFNTLPLRLQLEELGKCRFMDRSEFADGVDKLRGQKIVIVGCGAQGLNQGLNLRDSGLDVSYALLFDCGFAQRVADVQTGVAQVESLIQPLGATSDNDDLLAANVVGAVSKFFRLHETTLAELFQLHPQR